MWAPEASVGFLVFLTTSFRLSETHTAVPLRGEPATQRTPKSVREARRNPRPYATVRVLSLVSHAAVYGQR